jgi:hypothetical protein
MAYSSTPSTFLVGASPVRVRRHRHIGAHPSLPDLEPAETGAQAARRSRFAARLRCDIATQAAELRRDPGSRNGLSRLCVYALNAVLLATAFPIGFAMLMFNLLLGENLKVTVHVVALTGFAVTLSSSDVVARVFGIG